MPEQPLQFTSAAAEWLQHVRDDDELTPVGLECLKKFVIIQEERRQMEIRLMDSVLSRVEGRKQITARPSPSNLEILSSFELDVVGSQYGSNPRTLPEDDQPSEDLVPDQIPLETPSNLDRISEQAHSGAEEVDSPAVLHSSLVEECPTMPAGKGEDLLHLVVEAKKKPMKGLNQASILRYFKKLPIVNVEGISEDAIQTPAGAVSSVVCRAESLRQLMPAPHDQLPDEVELTMAYETPLPQLDEAEILFDDAQLVYLFETLSISPSEETSSLITYSEESSNESNASSCRSTTPGSEISSPTSSPDFEAAKPESPVVEDFFSLNEVLHALYHEHEVVGDNLEYGLRGDPGDGYSQVVRANGSIDSEVRTEDTFDLGENLQAHVAGIEAPVSPRVLETTTGDLPGYGEDPQIPPSEDEITDPKSEGDWDDNLAQESTVTDKDKNEDMPDTTSSDCDAANIDTPMPNTRATSIDIISSQI
ncbi:hypothetical protein E8E12_007104 [Didymella heteroderae]|uniref:Uncharacterized protein n=1 Tax=Didymella heteroderae TaxID=1769908 RepID=A0A9P5C086_9PLEO|nr:hypothetical protein E8E12_007104 [Didymella heteroderae]